jgi:hypothetical protein
MAPSCWSRRATLAVIALAAASLPIVSCAAYGTVPSLCDDNYCAEGGVDASPDGASEATVSSDAAPDALSDVAHDVAVDSEAGCSAPTTLNCNGVCVDPTLPQYCGTCTNQCQGPDAGMGQATCTAGVCGLGCASPTTLNCSGSCVDPSQPAHCGSCGNTCPTPSAGTGTAICTLGSDGGATCSVTCTGATTETCGDACYAPTDPNHCGSCSNACPPPLSGNGQATCAGATPTCGVSCSGGYHVCNANCLANTDEPSDTSDPCVLTETFGIFVAPTGSDTTGKGTRAAPYATIGHGMDQATASSLTRVYACGTAGHYTENLVVGSSRAGLSVYGGLDCTTTPGTWSYNAADQAVITPATGYAAAITASVTFEDTDFVAAPGVSSTSNMTSASSIAVFVSDATGVVLERCDAQAGAAASGASSAQPAPYGTTAPVGNAGSAPIAAGGTGAGGAAMPNPACTTSVGGAGGSAKLGESITLLDGQPGQPGANNAGTSAECAATEEGGGMGVAGAAGSSGAAATTWATFSASGWSPTGGQAGGPAAVGQGGGGGGTTAAANSLGGGGGGGAGGCGGVGGQPGSGGGSSVAVLVFDSVVTLESCTLSASNAGGGGNGAAGQTGQGGGTGGAGSTGGCGGGTGAAGGSGGPGSGGAGGVSAGVLWTGTAPTVTGGTQTFGVEGAAGKNGDGSTTATDGTAGGVVQFQ